LIFEAARRYTVADGKLIPVRDRDDVGSPQVALLPPGTTIVCVEVAESAAAAAKPNIRISAPAGWISTDALVDAPHRRSLALSWEEFEANHLRIAAGDQYNLIFPFSHEMLQSMGADFLTEAFRAAGTLDSDNCIEALFNYQILDAGGASTSAAFDVVYRKALPGLHTQLFVKMPAADPMRKFISSHMLYGETQIAMRQYYFGDYCRETSNGILVTERIGFGEAPIEPVLPKGLDQLLPDAAERYAVLTSLQARLVAFHKRGGLGFDTEDIFPFRAKITGMPAVEIDPLIDFIEDKVGHLLPAKYLRPSFLSQLRQDGERILDSLDMLSGYIGRDVDYTGFCHANLNLDNAWFWRTPTGNLQAGLIDWGSAGQMSLGQSFQGMLFASEPSKFLALRQTLVSHFVAEYKQASGVTLDGEKLLLHAKIASITGLPLLVFAIGDALGRYSKADLRGISNTNDPRLSTDSGLGTMLSMLGIFLEEWFDIQTPRAICDRILREVENGEAH
jgi:hypothetical protein